MNKTCEEAMSFRHACKEFESNKKIPKEEISFILNAGIQSPSSFGLELTQYLVIDNQELKDKIKQASMNQEQVSQCSHLVVILVSVKDAKVESGVPRKRFQRLGLPDETLELFVNMYAGFSKTHLKSTQNIYDWTSKQAYISLGNIMTAAAVKGVDSCPIEGFEKEKVEDILGVDTSVSQVALILPLGYRKTNPRDSVRLHYKEIVSYIH